MVIKTNNKGEKEYELPKDSTRDKHLSFFLALLKQHHNSSDIPTLKQLIQTRRHSIKSNPSTKVKVSPDVYYKILTKAIENA